MTKTRLLIFSIIAIFCIALIAGNIFGHFMKSSMLDPDGLNRLARHFAVHGDLNGSIRRCPIYPVFLGSIYKIFGESGPIPISSEMILLGERSKIIFFQSILLGILGICTFMISYEIFQSTKIAFLTGICTILHPICIWYVPKFWAELLFAILILVMIWSAYKAISDPTLWNLIKFGVFTGIASLCKAVILLFPLFLAVSVIFLCIIRVKLFNYLNWKTLFKIIVIPTSIMFITISPWTIRNYIVSNTWTLVSSNVGVEFFRGNVYADNNSFLLQKTIVEIWFDAVEKERQILSQRRMEEKNSNKELDNDIVLNKDEIFNSMMREFIVYHPLKFMIKILKQIPAFWMRGETTKKSIVFIFFALTILTFFIRGFYVLRKTSVFAYIVLILVIYFNLLYAAILAWARYSMPVYPPMLIICLYGIIQCDIVKDKGKIISKALHLTC